MYQKHEVGDLAAATPASRRGCNNTRAGTCTTLYLSQWFHIDRGFRVVCHAVPISLVRGIRGRSSRDDLRLPARLSRIGILARAILLVATVHPKISQQDADHSLRGGCHSDHHARSRPRPGPSRQPAHNSSARELRHSYRSALGHIIRTGLRAGPAKRRFPAAINIKSRSMTLF